MSHYIIIGSLTSPFVRMVRALCEELGLVYVLEDTGPFGKQTSEQKALIDKNNPLLKVPVLIKDGQVIIDSRIISSHLLETCKISTRSDFDPASSIERENLLTVIYGIIDAGVLRFILQRDGLDMQIPYLRRSLDRMEKGLAYLDSSKELGLNFGLPELALICGLDWFRKRDVIDWSGCRNIVNIHERFSERPSLSTTRIPENV